MAYRDGKSDCGLTSTGSGGSGGSSFLEIPDLLDDSTEPFFYFGWTIVNGSWLVRRQERNSSISNDATISSNLSYANLAEAWASRTILVF